MPGTHGGEHIFHYRRLPETTGQLSAQKPQLHGGPICPANSLLKGVLSMILKARAFLVEPICHMCGRPATHVELRQEGDSWRFIYRGIGGWNGDGDIVSEGRAALLTATFADPPHFDLMREADLHYDNAGFCEQCRVAYCYTHWNTTTTGYGTCPHGHGKSLDPHWSPED